MTPRNRSLGKIAKRELHQDVDDGNSMPCSKKPLKERGSSTKKIVSSKSPNKPSLTKRQLTLLQRRQKEEQGPRISCDRSASGRSKVHKRSMKGETPLHRACIRGNISSVRNLLEQGANINARDNAGWTPLHEACNHGHVDIVSVLIDRGVNINVPGMGGDTPLHDAVVNNHKEVVSLLLRNGADATIKNSGNRTPLDICRLDSISTLLETALLTKGDTSEEEDVFADETTPEKQPPSVLLQTHTPPPTQTHSLALENEYVRSEETPPPHFNMGFDVNNEQGLEFLTPAPTISPHFTSPTATPPPPCAQAGVSLKAELNELNRREESMQNELMDIRQKLNQIEIEMDLLRKRIPLLENSREDLEKKCDDLTHEYQEILSSKQTLLLSKIAYTQSNVSLQAGLYELNRKERSVQTKLMDSRQTLNEVKNKIHLSQNELLQLEDTKEDIMKKRDNLSCEYQEILSSKRALLTNELHITLH